MTFGCSLTHALGVSAFYQGKYEGNDELQRLGELVIRAVVRQYHHDYPAQLRSVGFVQKPSHEFVAGGQPRSTQRFR